MHKQNWLEQVKKAGLLQNHKFMEAAREIFKHFSEIRLGLPQQTAQSEAIKNLQQLLQKAKIEISENDLPEVIIYLMVNQIKEGK